MGIKTYRPYTPSRRQMTGSDFARDHKDNAREVFYWLQRPDRQDVTIKVKSQLDTAEAELRRNIELSTSREEKTELLLTVIGIEYDPNRTANIALICYEDGEKHISSRHRDQKDGMKVMNGPEAEVKG